MTSDWRQALGKDSRGSRPRCVALVDGTGESVSSSLTDLVGHPAVEIRPTDLWLPNGKPVRRGDAWDTRPAREARLDRDAGFVPQHVQRELRGWWLAVARGANTPNWDLAATCTVDGRQGVLLVEAKAHEHELYATGKALPKTDNGRKNHARIATAIAQANVGLGRASGGQWALSRDSHYQLSNRFAWAWKLAAAGVPAVLVYLGFLDAEDVAGNGPLFRTHEDWAAVVRRHGNGIVDHSCWDRQLEVAGVPLCAVIRSCRVAVSSP